MGAGSESTAMTPDGDEALGSGDLLGMEALAGAVARASSVEGKAANESSGHRRVVALGSTGEGGGSDEVEAGHSGEVQQSPTKI